jgi:cytochrome b
MESDQPQATPSPAPALAAQKVWDVPTRLVHWALAIGIGVSWWSVENKMMDVHYWSGLTLLGVLVFRIYWGFAGPETARFSHFIKGPAAVFGYIPRLFSKDYSAAFGHNPLGALSVVALLLAVIVQVGLGLFASDTDGLFAGPLNRHIDYDTAKDVTDLHEDFFNVLFALILLHLAAIAFYLVVKRINLIGPMLTGKRRGTNLTGPARGIEPIPLWRLAIGIVLAVAVVWFAAR